MLLSSVAAKLRPYLPAHNACWEGQCTVLPCVSMCVVCTCVPYQDFGLSARLSGDATHVSNYSKGTPFYVAPEVCACVCVCTSVSLYVYSPLLWFVSEGE